MSRQDWCPFAITRAPVGDAAKKHGYEGVVEPGSKMGLVVHSMEGYMAGAMAELDKVSRRASWTFSNPKRGPLLQHFPVGYHTWASGSLEANVRFSSLEDEGMENDPLTENQIQNAIKLIRWLHDSQGWEGYRRKEELWEHRETVLTFGGGATACPSERFTEVWREILDAVREEESEQDMATYELIKASNGAYTFVAAKVGNVYLWRKYIGSQVELLNLQKELGLVKTIGFLELAAITRIDK